MIRKVIIPAAGLGTRLLPITKELPKEMLPLPFKNKDGRIYLKPMLQAVFEQLYEVGFREFCFVVGRGKRAIEDHFTPDWDFVEYLKGKNKNGAADCLEEFYTKIGDSTIIFVNQPKPRGFGDAIFLSKNFTSNESFLVHAGDDLVFSLGEEHLKRLVKVFDSNKASVVLLAERVKDARMYGVVVGTLVDKNLYQVSKVLEKPKKPPTDLAAIAISAYTPSIYKALERVKPDENNEIQLTAAVQQLIEDGHKVYAVELEPHERRIDIGGPERYLESLRKCLSVDDECNMQT